MDIIDKIFSKLKKDQASSDLRARILSIPQPRQQARPGFWRSLKVAVPALLIVLMVATGAYYKYFRVTNYAAAFELEPELADTAGMMPGSDFILKSSKPLSDYQVKKALEFSPSFDYDVEDLGSGRYRIKPKGDLEQNKVYTAAIKQGAGDRDYSWAFQVKAPFQVLQTLPRDKSGYVPTNTGIELTFNREGFVEPQKFLEISPKAEGRVEVRGDTLVFVPKALEERTVYTVTVKKGLQAKGSQDELLQDYSFAFETGENQYRPAADFNFSDDFAEFLPGKKPSLGVYYWNMEPKDIKLSVYKLPSAGEFLDSYLQSRQWDLSWAYYYRLNRGASFVPKENQKVFSGTAGVSSVSSWQHYLELPQALDNGYYVVQVEAGGRTRQAWLQITPLAHYFSLTAGNGLMWVYDFEKKSPLADSQVSFYGSDKEKSGLAKTNGQGLAEFDTPEALKASGQQQGLAKPQFLSVEAAGLPEVLVKAADNWDYRTAPDAPDEYWQHLSTDRYTFQMDDTIRFWGVLKGRSRDIRQQQVQVGLYKSYYFGPLGGNISPENKPLVTANATVSAFDTITGSLSFKGLAPDAYTLVVTKDNRVISSTMVQVLTYAKPAYGINVTADRQAVYAGEPVTFKVKTGFFDGTPVSGLKLKYEAYWDASINGEVTLNDNGEAQVTYTPKYSETPYSYYPRNLQFNFFPAVSEEGEITGSGSVLVFGPRIHLQSYQQNDDKGNFTYTAKANLIDISKATSGNDYVYPSRPEYIGEPAASLGLSAAIVKITYDKVPEGQYYDPINKVTEESYRYVPREEVVERLSGSTDQNGEWKFTRNLPKAENVSYRVDFTGRDAGGRNIKSTAYAYYAAYGGWDKFNLSLSINDESYEKQFSVGEAVKLKLDILEGELSQNAPVLYYRYQNNIDRVEVRASRELEEKFEKSFAPSVQYRAVVLGPYGFKESNGVMASYKEEDSKLDIQIEPDKQAYRPGEKITLQVKVQDKDRKPVEAEVNVAAVDEAVFHILPYSWQEKILPALYRNIYAQPLTGASVYNLSGAQGGGGAEGGCFLPGTRILLPGGITKPIEDIKVGDKILTRESEHNGKLVPAIVQGISSHEVDEYLVINNALMVTPEHRMFISGKWQEAGLAKVGDTLITDSGQTKAIGFIERVYARNTVVHNIVVDNYHTYFAQGYYAHNAEKGGGAARMNFVDTAHYENLRTSGSGQATISFIAPDNVTSWRVTAKAFDGRDIRAGEESMLVKAGLPLFVDAVTSGTYLTGDEAEIRLQVFGEQYNKNQPTEFSVKSQSLGLERTLSEKTNTAYVKLGKLPPGAHSLEISAKQGNLQDKIIKKIETVDSYFKTAQVSEYQVSASMPALSGNQDGFTEILLADAGKGKFYNFLAGHIYSQGLRLDQAAVANYSQKLLSEYFGKQGETEPLDLSPYHVPQGGLSLLPYSDSDLELSAFTADLAPEFVYQDKLVEYFNKSLRDGKADVHRSARALYGLASLNQPVLNKLQLLKTEDGLTAEDRAFVALGLAKLGDQEGARKIYENDLRSALRFQGGEAWVGEGSDQTRQTKLTSLLGVAASYAGKQDDAAALWQYMNYHGPVRDLDILEKTLLAKSSLKKSGSQETRLTLKTSQRQEDVELKDGQTFSLALPAEELQTLRFENVRGEARLLTFYQRSRDPKELQINSELSVTRKYLVNNKETQTFKEGDVVLVRLDPDIAQSALDGSYQVVDYLPSGLKPITRPFEQGLSYSTGCDAVWYPTRIENNTLYFNIWKGFDRDSLCGNRTLNYYARVVSRGTFNANPALIQSLKDPGSLNLSPSASVVIAPRN